MNLRVALIGCGLIGQKRLNLLAPGSVTVACDTQLDRAKKLPRKVPAASSLNRLNKPSVRRTWTW